MEAGPLRGAKRRHAIVQEPLPSFFQSSPSFHSLTVFPVSCRSVRARAVRLAQNARVCDGYAGAYSATAGLPVTGAPGDPRGASSRALLELSGASRPRGLPFGTHVAAIFYPEAHFGFPLGSLTRTSRSHLEPVKAVPGSTPLLTLCWKRVLRASWMSAPQHESLPSRRRSLATWGAGSTPRRRQATAHSRMPQGDRG